MDEGDVSGDEMRKGTGNARVSEGPLPSRPAVPLAGNMHQNHPGPGIQ